MEIKCILLFYAPNLYYRYFSNFYNDKTTSSLHKYNFIEQHTVNFVFELSFLKLSCYLAIKCKLSDLFFFAVRTEISF